jgi:hypothetical protein
MNMRSSGIRGVLPAALVVGLGLLVVPEAAAHGGGHAGGGAVRAPHITAPRPTMQQPRMPRAATTHGNSARAGAHGNSAHAPTNRAHAQPNTAHTGANTVRNHPNAAQAHMKTGPAHPNAAQARANLAPAHTNHAAGTLSRSATLGATKAAAAARGHTTLAAARRVHPYLYTYGHGLRARHFRALGYGLGFRHHYYRGLYAYGRFQGVSRALVARLRSVHASLARIDRDYQGHRVQAMQAIAMGVRQLSHGSMSMGYRTMGFARGGTNRLALGMRRVGLGPGGASRGPLMPQAVSDARMGRALRTLQGISMQLSSQGYGNMGRARASGYVQHAMQELYVALSIR